jgi:hypothetical protein
METSGHSRELVLHRQRFAQTIRGWKLIESSGDGRIPDDAVFSTDACLVGLEHWQELTAELSSGVTALGLNQVVEPARPRNEGPIGLNALKTNMAANLTNGALLCWLQLHNKRASSSVGGIG